MRCLLIFFSSVCFLCTHPVLAESTAEELRLASAREAMPVVFKRVDALTQSGIKQIKAATSANSLIDTCTVTGEQLWRASRSSVDIVDDRVLYWSRLTLTQIIRNHDFKFPVSGNDRIEATEQVEAASRGRIDVFYPEEESQKRILITGFDPFLLDNNIAQSNPSGIIALRLDNTIIEHNNTRAYINTVTFPVRYKDFDDGELESLLAPIYAIDAVDMVVTISMGRDQFDLERFPGRRRSATAPGNLNELSGASATDPIVPLLNRRALAGPEFVETSLPVSIMKSAKGNYEIRDRHLVTTLDATFEPQSLSQLRNAIAVNGSGGGYLSNEISYRSIRLRNLMGSSIPTGHIHTPRISGFDKEEIEAIVTQVQTMLELSLAAIEDPPNAAEQGTGKH